MGFKGQKLEFGELKKGEWVINIKIYHFDIL